MEERLTVPYPGGRAAAPSLYLLVEADAQEKGLTCPGTQREEQGRLHPMSS